MRGQGLGSRASEQHLVIHEDAILPKASIGSNKLHGVATALWLSRVLRGIYILGCMWCHTVFQGPKDSMLRYFGWGPLITKPLALEEVNERE